jgi:D-alanyl-lipoteichoic acid acyltransferase DltB (MBOAT superfamily)
MQFNSYSYLLLLIPAVALFWALPARLRKSYLLILSFLFYASWNVSFTLLPVVMCAVAYVCARKIAVDSPESGAWLRIGIVITLLPLVAFKYSRFLIETLNTAMGRSPIIMASAAIALPLGISFYSFEVISYLLDTKQGRTKTMVFSDLVLFVMFWPHLVAGPIVRVRELVPQFRFDRTFDSAMLFRGLDRIVWGLVQKNLIANSLGTFVDEGFLPKAAFLNTAVDNWFLAVAFGLQVYFDFSAYSNMAIGTAQLLGITLPENFNYPFHAKNPADFWSRWHMTLSRWVRDYLFFPLTAKYRAAPIPLYLSLVGIMGLVGLWHGAGWGFIVWGVLHGLYLALYRAWELAWPQSKDAWYARVGWRVATLAGVTIAWVPFRASSAAQAFRMMATMLFRVSFSISYEANFYLVIALVALFYAAQPYLASALNRLETSMVASRLWLPHPQLLRPLLYATGLLLFMIFDERDTTFLYFQF